MNNLTNHVMSSRKQVPHFQLCQGTRNTSQVQSALENTCKVQVGSPTWAWDLWTASKGCFHSIDSHVPGCFFCRGKCTGNLVSSSERMGAEIKAKRDSCTVAVMLECTQHAGNLTYVTVCN